VTTILLPAYLSYKALRSHDPAQSHPWLIYFTILSLTLLFESWTLFIIGWVPFYSWFRLFFLLYLVLPQTQGAKILYLNYLEPYILDHESRIDNFITETHHMLQDMGMGYFNSLIEFFREKILGQASPQQNVPAGQGYASYAQDLLARFAMPSARGTADGSGIYNMVSGLAGAMVAGRPRDATSEAASIPDTVLLDIHGSSADKAKAIATQRERLSAILKSLETEQQNIDLAYGAGPGQKRSASGLKTKSKSEQSFENVSYDEAAGSDELPPKKVTDRRSTSGSWVPGVSGWWGNIPPPAEKGSDKKESNKGWSAARDIVDAMAEGTSTGYDRGN
jgi:receptor expression-enhancing protein 1/2/3/4